MAFSEQLQIGSDPIDQIRDKVLKESHLMMLRIFFFIIAGYNKMWTFPMDQF
jgi:hypothetical protein